MDVQEEHGFTRFVSGKVSDEKQPGAFKST